MPRHTHPEFACKHSRAHLYEQRSRFIRRNWQRAKQRYGTSYRRYSLHPEVQRATPEDPDAWWPFNLPANMLTRNPFNLCSCPMCSHRPGERRRRRRQEERWLRGDVQDQLEGGEALPRSAHLQGQPPKFDSW